jgi:hypothetical protein
MRKYVIAAVCAIGLAIATPAAAWANQTPGNPTQNPTTGHKAGPTNTCGSSNPMTPGNSANAPGSPFNSTTPGQAGNVYAGNPGTDSLHSNSTAPVSQYDNACINLSSH